MSWLVNILRLLFLAALLLGPSGCATTRPTYDDDPGLEPSHSVEDDSHGWGAGVGNAN